MTQKQRERMVQQQLVARGIEDQRVLDAISKIPRELFVPQNMRPYAYGDHALSIGQGQTISQPYMVALMAEALAIEPTDRVLEVGAGCGYAAALMAQLAKEVFGIERYESLVEEAKQRLDALGYHNIFLHHGDGTLGWPGCAPFDVISVAAAGPHVPHALLEQLKIGGRLVMPIGESSLEQVLYKVTKTGESEFTYQDLGLVRFVPLIGIEGLPL